MTFQSTGASFDQDSVDARAEALIDAVAEHLELIPQSGLQRTLMERLAESVQLLERRNSPTDTDDAVDSAELLIAILRLQRDVLDRDLSRRVRSAPPWQIFAGSPRAR